MSEAAHSKFSASAAHRWMACPGSLVLSAGLPDKSSKYAEEGTEAHSLLEDCLRVGNGVARDGGWPEDMADAVNTALDNIREMTTGADLLLPETRVNYANYLGVPEAEGWGTADVIAIVGDELQVHDYKHGRGVEVDAEDNEQMKLYGLGALNAYEDVADLTTVRLVIHQPRIKQAPSEWTISVDELKKWGSSTARSAAASVLNAEQLKGNAAGAMMGREWESTFLRPGEDQCRFCRAKATCPALRSVVAETVFESVPATADEFADAAVHRVSELPVDSEIWLAACMSKADLIEDWLKAVRAEVERRLLAGQPVPGYKLVQGKQGDRAWSDEAEAEALLKKLRLKQDVMYSFKVKSPTQIAKLGPAFDKDGKTKPPKPGEEPPLIGPRQWPKVAALITRAPGKPSVAPLSDKREALVVGPVADEFQPVGDAADFV